MIIFKAAELRDFYKLFMEIQSIRYKFSNREIAIGAEFLLYREIYSKAPIHGEAYEGEAGKEKLVIVTLTPMEQLKDGRTLTLIKKNIGISSTILRKHVTGLKEKGFFSGGDISSEFLTDGINVAFNLQRK